jgi:RimJ/RimL family protein N-acetyltransferase
LDWNTRAQRCFEKCGFTVSGSLVSGDYHFMVMEIARPQEPENIQ